MTSTASARAALPSPSMPSPSPSSLAASSASSANSYGHAANTPPPFSAHAPPPPATCDDLDNKVAEFKRQWTSKGLGAGPDAMLLVQEYATFLPRPWGFKDRSSGSGRPSSNDDWTMPRTPPRTVSGYAAGYGPLLPPTRRAASRARQSLPTPPLEKVRGALEMMIKLPAPMSPTIPAWPVSTRPVTGGKQPGKMPTVPPNLLGDDTSDSDDDSDRSSSAVESESVVLSEADANPRYKAIGRKTAKHANTKGRTAGKRPTKSFAEKSTRSQTACSSEFCKLLSSEQIKVLPRKSGGQLSLSPVMIKINIPSFLLPAPRHVIEDPVKATGVKTRARSPAPVASPSERNKPSSKRLASDEEREPHRQFKATKRRSTPMSDSDTDRSIRKPEGGSVKESKSKSRDGHSRSRRHSRDDDSRRSGQREREDRDKSGKHRARDRSRNRSRSRSRSWSRSSRGRYEREERPSSKKTRQPELGRERSDRPSLKRRDRSRSKDKERDLSRDKTRDMKKVRSRSRSRSRDRERTGDRRQNDKRNRDSAPASTSRAKLESKDGGRVQESQASKKDSDRRKSSSIQGSSSAFDLASRRDSQSAIRAGSSSPQRSTSKSRPQQDSLPKTSSAGSLDNTHSGTASGKKLHMEEYQRKRLGTDMDTPKLTAESPALVASSPLPAGKAGHPLDENVRKSSAREANTNKDTKYFREYRKYHTLAVNLKRKADEINRVQNNARLSAIVYFLSSNAFIRAFHLNDRHLAHLHPTRPDLAQEEAMKCWESMKQFSRSLSAQCRDNIQALSGLSYLLEALVYFKCHMYSNYRLRKEMQALDQFKKALHQQSSSSSSSNESTMVTISADLGFRVLQNAEDWANLQRKLDDCKAVLTPDFAREQFPDTFSKWCIHPEEIGRADMTTKFSMTVEQLQKVVSGVGADGTVVYENRIRTFPRIQWPLGTHMQLGDLMDFAEEALREYQTRNGLEYEVLSPNG